jgi:hypothetical protein
MEGGATLEERAAACFEWRDGMIGSEGFRLERKDHGDGGRWTCINTGMGGVDACYYVMSIPEGELGTIVLDDDANRGVMLAQVREACGDPCLTVGCGVFRDRETQLTRPAWHTVSVVSGLVEAPFSTEAEALIAAKEAADKRGA